MKQLLIAFVVFLLNFTALAQSDSRLGNWTGFNSTITLHEHWALFVQGEYRTWEFLTNSNELLWRVSGQYKWKNKQVALGYVYVDTWPDTGEPFQKFSENRFFQEFQVKYTMGQTTNDHRLRLEQRWIGSPEEGTNLSHRIRYSLGFTIPIKKNTLVTRSFFRFSNELFMDLDKFDYWFNREGDKAGLNQNRLYGGIGYNFSRPSSIQTGLLWQHRPRANYLRLVVSYTHNFD